MATTLAINGFGRIGRQAVRAMLEKITDKDLGQEEIKLVAVNDLADPQTLAHLMKYDSVYGILPSKVGFSDKSANKLFRGEIFIDNMAIGVLNEPDPANLPWKKLGVDVVIESTGRFTDKASAGKHLAAGAKRVIVSAPAKGDIGTYIIGVNMDKLKKNEKIISNASCTTNCIAPIMAIMEERFGIAKSLMTTIHSFTADQVLVDGPHRDLRRARSASINIVPTTTGAAIAAAETVPTLKNKFDGLSIRVPTAVGSVSDITMVTKREATPEEINEIIKKECQTSRWQGILTFTEEPLVSTDIIGNPHSAIVDLSLTQVIGGNLVKLIVWYDNEWGYSNRMVEQVAYIGNLIKNI